MNPKSYRTPTQPDSTRVRCPVCHEAVYSRAGIHPQCAVRQSDPPRPKAKAQGAVVNSGEAPTAVEPVGADVVADLPAVP
jgi:hypothetical protein